MDIEMINKFLKVVIAAVVLSASGYANIASAFVVEVMPTHEPLLTKYNWSATCYDCNYDKMGFTPEEDLDLWTEVQGTISLLDYEFGDEINNDNFSSFVYSGVSNWLPTFAVGGPMLHGYDYDLGNIKGSIKEDGTVNLSFIANLKHIEMVEAAPALDVPKMRYLPYNLLININDGLWDISAYKPVQPECKDNDFWDPEQNTCVNEEEAPPMKEEPKSVSPVVKIDIVLDHGQDFVLSGFDTNNKGPISEVPEPSTLAIFALGLMGLGLRRFKK
jgi:hypothetical protein